MTDQLELELEVDTSGQCPSTCLGARCRHPNRHTTERCAGTGDYGPTTWVDTHLHPLK